MQELELSLLNDYQRGFPLMPAPFSTIANALGVSEEAVLDTLRKLRTEGHTASDTARWLPCRCRSIGWKRLPR
jgi:DNA-binding Lrp family transcriptional regulator